MKQISGILRIIALIGLILGASFLCGCTGTEETKANEPVITEVVPETETTSAVPVSEPVEEITDEETTITSETEISADTQEPEVNMTDIVPESAVTNNTADLMPVEEITQVPESNETIQVQINESILAEEASVPELSNTTEVLPSDSDKEPVASV